MEQSHFKNCIAFPEGKALALSFDGVLYLLDNGRMTRLYEGACEGIPGLSEADHIHLHHISGDLYLVSNTTDDDERMVVRLWKPRKGVIDKSGGIIIPVDYDVLDYCKKESTFRAMVNDPFGMPKIIRRFDLAGQLIDEEQL